MTKIILGTRGSKLSLVQTDLVIEALKREQPDIEIEKKIITTKGDLNQSPIPLDTVGKAWFTGEIEQALSSGAIDIAVHSLKDLPPDIAEGSEITVVLKRGDPADVLVSKNGEKLSGLKKAAVIGTDSIRRKAMLLAERPDLIVKSVRGNVDTRLKKLESEDYDAIVIAAAGLQRLGIADRITERFDPTKFIPAPGQAALAVQSKVSRIDIHNLVSAIVHSPTVSATRIEEAFSKAVGGGCKLPIGCYAEVDQDRVSIYAFLGNSDGTRVARRSSSGDLSDGMKLAAALAAECLEDPAVK